MYVLRFHHTGYIFYCDLVKDGAAASIIENKPDRCLQMGRSKRRRSHKLQWEEGGYTQAVLQAVRFASGTGPKDLISGVLSGCSAWLTNERSSS